MAKDEATSAGPGWERGFSLADRPLGLYALFATLAFAIYWPALQGPLIGDDEVYLANNPFVASLGTGAVLELFRPGGPASLYVVNYAPLHLLWLGVERALFGAWLPGYHAANVLVHALNALLLVVLLRRSKLAPPLAVCAGLLFLVHPANVEAVAWISQSKTDLSLTFALAALIGLRDRPVLSLVSFAAALLFKASAVFALPMAWVLAYCAGLDRRRVVVLSLWTVVFALYAVGQFEAFAYGGRHEEPLFADPFVHLRTIAAFGLRYLVMAASSYGLAALQEPGPVESLLDAWWLLAVPVACLLLARIVVTLRRRSDEAAFWIGAAAAFLPVSQIFPFLHPMADRYLYPVLPGLLGGCFLAIQAAKSRSGRPATTVCVAATLVLALFFAVRSANRMDLWASPTATLVEAAQRFPNGSIAWYMRAREAARQGDAAGLVAALEKARERSAHRNYFADPAFAAFRENPAFLFFAREQAGRRIAYARENDLVTQHWLRVTAHDHLVREELEEALARLEQARRVGGVFDDVLVVEIEAAREMVVAKRRGEPIPKRFQPIGSGSRN